MQKFLVESNYMRATMLHIQFTGNYSVMISYSYISLNESSYKRYFNQKMASFSLILNFKQLQILTIVD